MPDTVLGDLYILTRLTLTSGLGLNAIAISIVQMRNRGRFSASPNVSRLVPEELVFESGQSGSGATGFALVSYSNLPCCQGDSPAWSWAGPCLSPCRLPGALALPLVPLLYPYRR